MMINDENQLDVDNHLYGDVVSNKLECMHLNYRDHKKVNFSEMMIMMVVVVVVVGMMIKLVIVLR